MKKSARAAPARPGAQNGVRIGSLVVWQNRGIYGIVHRKAREFSRLSDGTCAPHYYAFWSDIGKSEIRTIFSHMAGHINSDYRVLVY